MGDIINIANLNKYTGRYSRHRRANSVEEKIGWYLSGNLREKFPVLSIRSRMEDNEEPSPLVWEPGRNTRMAAAVILDTLKAWQAFRPRSEASVHKRLMREISKVATGFQKQMGEVGIQSARDLAKAGVRNPEYADALFFMSRAVGRLSRAKGSDSPMLGSKILHLLYPELFPVWDNAWINKEALAKEDVTNDDLGAWLPERALRRLGNLEYRKAAITYARYLALMARDLRRTSPGNYRKIEAALIRHAEIPSSVVRWHFHDLRPLVFEVCLLGKHVG
ncbi:MAG: hypothetical protein FJY73_08220 [Candidatus Eisenbacteria bacterium]|nr:hypothetical protein [Candidatus Eisenbacteria bacterium]